jgi:hypothetical protein
VIAVTDPSDPFTQANTSAKVREPIEVSSIAGAPGELVELDLNGSSVSSFCNPTAGAAGKCGA